MVESNPYSTPQSPLDNVDEPNVLISRYRKKGPALYIVIGAFICGLPSPIFLMARNPIGLLFPLVGCISGALIYRWRSRNWPIDPNAKTRIMSYSILAIILPTMIMFILTRGGESQGAGMVIISLLVGISVATGILFSGTRRHGGFDSIPNTKSGG